MQVMFLGRINGMAEKEQLQSAPSRTSALLSFLAVANLFLVIGGCIGSTVYHHYEVKPPAAVKDFESYLREMRPPSELMVLQEKGKLILVATGNCSFLAGLHIPSGPPQYVFDSNGTLIDWVDDCGDGTSWFPGTLTPLVKRLTVPEARAWLAEQRKSAQSP